VGVAKKEKDGYVNSARQKKMAEMFATDYCRKTSTTTERRGPQLGSQIPRGNKKEIAQGDKKVANRTLTSWKKKGEKEGDQIYQ